LIFEVKFEFFDVFQLGLAGNEESHRRWFGRKWWSRLGQSLPVSAVTEEVREKKKKKKGERACVRGEGEEEEKKERKKPGEEACVRGEGEEEEEACVRGEGEEEEEKKKKEEARGGREGEVKCFVLILICVFFEVSACEWRGRKSHLFAPSV
jgi:hypothetical protein